MGEKDVEVLLGNWIEEHFQSECYWLAEGLQVTADDRIGSHVPSRSLLMIVSPLSQGSNMSNEF